MKPIELTPDTFDATVSRPDVPVLVDFHASWCGPCKMLAPVIDQVAEARGEDAVVAKLDIDAAPAIAQRYRITSVPTLMVFRNGEPVAASRGMQSRAAIEALLDEAVSATA